MNSEEVLAHWRYFLSLEKDVEILKNYIEISENNYSAYSIELSKLLQLSCAEIDSVCRLLCKNIDPSTKFADDSTRDGNIHNYAKIILNRFPKLILSEIEVPGISNRLQPWKDWNDNRSPDWWNKYNKVKHYRHSNFNHANLENMLNSMAALMILILYLYRSVKGKAYAYPDSLTSFFSSDYSCPVLSARAEKELPDF